MTVSFAISIGAGVQATPQLDAKTVHVQVKNESVRFPDAPPLVDRTHRIQVPLRFVSEHLGFQVHYESNTNRKKVILQSEKSTIQLNVNDAVAIVNDQPVTLDSPPILINNRLYAPLRFLAEVEQIPVHWNSEMRLAVLDEVKPVWSDIQLLKAVNSDIPEQFAQLGQAFEATAYSAAAEENGPWGAVDYFGNPLQLGTIAVDPKVIPLGSTVYIRGYDFDGLPSEGLVAIASDIGGAIKGNRIDIFIPGSSKKVRTFGIQSIEVHLLENP